jgi:hypothetical protein
MTDHAHLLARYKQIRAVRFRLNQVLVRTIPTKTLQDCGRELGLFREGTFVFDSEDEMPILMDYTLYRVQRDGRNLVAKYLETSPPPGDSDEMLALQSMTRAYYSLFQITDVERGVGVAVQDVFRKESAFIVDVGFGSTAQRNLLLATRVIPFEGSLTTGGAALPLQASTARRVLRDLVRIKLAPDTFDFKQITLLEEAKLTATIIRSSLAAGASSHVVYAEPGSQPRALATVSKADRPGRNDRCPCGSGRKYKMCCALL